MRSWSCCSTTQCAEPPAWPACARQQAVSRVLLLSVLPEGLRHAFGPLQRFTDGPLEAPMLRQLLVALAMTGITLWRPQGPWAGRR